LYNAVFEQIEVVRTARVPQDLHVHTVFSYNDGAIEPQQTVELVAAIRHAQVLGISDHFEHIAGERFGPYRDAVLAHGLLLGTEVNGPDWVAEAAQAPVEYYNLHCPDTPAHYAAAERLLETGRPVIIAHPMLLGTNLDKVPPECLIEINNRYVWRNDWRTRLTPYVNRFRFVIGSDAHQPHWLNQNPARWVATQLGVRETILFPERLNATKEVNA
jgi:histidinol phosphatase-like PHP family hydrolase